MRDESRVPIVREATEFNKKKERKKERKKRQDRNRAKVVYRIKQQKGSKMLN